MEKENKEDIDLKKKKTTRKVVKKIVKKETKDKEIKEDKVKVDKKIELPLEEPKKASKKDDIKEDTFINKNIEFNLLEVIIIILITGVLVSLASGVIIYNNYDKLFNKETTTCESSDELKEVVENYNYILNDYVGEVDKEDLVDAAIAGMYAILDDQNTFYIDKTNNDTLQDTLTGEYEGIGVEITTSYDADKETYSTYISRVFKDSVAEKAGLKAGDVFLELNGVDLSDKDSSYVADIIKNGAQTENTIKVLRDGNEVTVNVTRAHIYIDSVHSEVKDGVGYIQLETFSLTTAEQVKKAIDGFDDSVTSLVIDLRDNTGGYTVSAYDTANLFIEEGKNIYQIKDKNNEITSYKADTGVYRKFDKIAVLVNGNSASSSEILALALKESAGATIVGVKSYGKGSVQDTKQLSSGAMVKYTIAYWLSPNGNSINETGITPDIIEEDVDKQIDTAIKAVK